jgi:hypothetical protein
MLSLPPATNDAIMVRNYLDKHYQVMEGKYIGKIKYEEEYGANLIKITMVIFMIDQVEAELLVRFWSFRQGMTEDEYIEKYSKFFTRNWGELIDQRGNIYMGIDAAVNNMVVLADYIDEQAREMLMIPADRINRVPQNFTVLPNDVIFEDALD